MEDICKIKKCEKEEKEIRPYKASTQLRYVMPRFSKEKEEKEKEMKEIRFKWMYCRYFWEADVELKEISLEVLNEWDRECRPEEEY
jgi:hypothetical protein